MRTVRRIVGLARRGKGRVILPSPDEREPGGYELFLRSLKERLSRGKNNVIIVDGDTGSGKSSVCISVAKMMYPAFNPRIHVVFSAREFMQVLGHLLDRDQESQNYRGAFIVLEEAETSSEGSVGAVQEFRKTLDVFRQWQVSVLINLPSRDRVSGLQYEVATHLIWTRDVDEGRRVVKAYWRRRYRSETRIWFAHPRDPNISMGARMEVPWVDKETWEAYQREKHKFFNILREMSMRRIERLAVRTGDISAYLSRFDSCTSEVSAGGDGDMKDTRDAKDIARALLGLADEEVF